VNPIGPRMMPNTSSPIAEQMYDAVMSPFWGIGQSRQPVVPCLCKSLVGQIGYVECIEPEDLSQYCLVVVADSAAYLKHYLMLFLSMF